MFSKTAIESIKAINIETIASQLGITVRNRKCCCPFHDDKHPSMALWPKINGWKCFACGEKGTSVDLVMKKLDLSYIEALRWMASENNIVERKNSKIERFKSPQMGKIKNSRKEKVNDILTLSVEEMSQSINSVLCQSLVSNGIFTEEQMRHTAKRYQLASTKDGGVIFWQMDEQGQLREGKVMWYESNCHRSKSRKPVTVSYLMKQRGRLPMNWQATQCLFGLHLLSKDSLGDTFSLPVAIVESEKTAIICSLFFPHCLWLASGGLSTLTAEKLLPLKGRRIILFPDTDTDGNAYSQWRAIAEAARSLLGHPVYVSDALEKNASEEQKQRKIDIADLLVR